MKKTHSAKWATLGLIVVGVAVVTYLIAMWVVGPQVRSSEVASARRKKTLPTESVDRLMNPATRVAEARRLGEGRVPAASSVLAQLCKDGDAPFRKACVWALGNIGDKEGVHALRIRVYDEDLEVRVETAKAFGRLYGMQAYQGLCDMMEDREEPVREAVAKSFASVVTRDKLALQRLTEMLKDSAKSVRIEAVRGMTSSTDEDATFALVQALKDADAEVRLAAAAAIAPRRSEAGYEGIGWMLGNEDASVRASAAQAAGQIGKPILPYLEKALTSSPSLPARLDAVAVLCRIGGTNAAPTLVRLFDGLEPKADAKLAQKLSDAVVEALSAMGAAAVPAIREGLLIGERVRLAEEAGAKACVRIGKASVPSIVESITRWKIYPDPEELGLWLDTLGQIGDPAALPALNRALSQEIEGMTQRVAEVRAAIEKKSGQKLPPCEPDPVAFCAEVERVQSLDLAAVAPVCPVTREVNRIPDTGVIFMTLWGALVRDAGRCPLHVELYRKDGAWVKRLMSRASFYNNRHHPGRIVKETTEPAKATLRVEYGVRNDEHIPGGYAEYDIEIRATDAGWVGKYEGHYNYGKVEGRASVECREGPATLEDSPIVGSGEHPRMFFRKEDLPVLRARAKTELGRKILQILRARSAQGKVEDWARYMNFVTTWSPGIQRAMGNALLAYVFEDPLHGERAASTAMLRMLEPAYAGEHGELQAIPLQLLGYGHDMAYNFWTPKERETVRPKVAGLWSWIAPNSSVTHAGEGAYGLILPPILSLLREKGVFNLPEPGGAMMLAVLEAPTPAPLADAAPVNTAAQDKMLTAWLAATGLDDGQDDPLADAGGIAKAEFREGASISYKGRAFPFKRMPDTHVQATPGFGVKPQCIVFPTATATTRTILHGLLDVKEELGGVLDCTHPLGHVASRIWLDGREVFNQGPVLLKPGLHRMTVLFWGKNVSPAFLADRGSSSRGERMRRFVEQAIWNEYRDEHNRTGEMAEIAQYAREAAQTLRRHLWYELDTGWRTGDFRGGAFARSLPAYLRVMGVPLSRDVPLPLTELPALTFGEMSDEYLCYTMQLVPTDWKRALLWEFNRRFLPDRLDRLPSDHLIAAYVNYPMTLEPLHPDRMLTRILANPRKGGYFFLSGVEKGGFHLFATTRCLPMERATREWTIGGFYQFRGFGVDWIRDGGWRHGVRSGHEVQNIVEIAGSEAAGYGKALYFTPQEDGSGALGIDMTGVYSGTNLAIKADRHLAVDYSGKSGAPALLAVVDRLDGGGKKTWTAFSFEKADILNDGREFVLSRDSTKVRNPDPSTLHGWLVWPRDAKWTYRELITAKHGDASTPMVEIQYDKPQAEFFVVMTVQREAPPKCEIAGEGAATVVKVGGQTVRFDGKQLGVGGGAPGTN